MKKNEKKKSIKKRFTCIALCVCMVVAIAALTSCNNNDTPNDTTSSDNIDTSVRGSHEIGNTGISVYTEMTKIDLEYSSQNLKFPIYFVSDRRLEDDEIKFVRFNGEHTDYFRTPDFSKKQIENVTDENINGKYLYLYNVDNNINIEYFNSMVDVERPEVWEIRIDSMVVEIKGKEYTIEFANPLKYNYNRDNSDDIEGNHMYGPIAVYTYGITERYSVNIYNYKNDINIKDFYFSDFLGTENKYLNYKGGFVGDIDGEKTYSVAQRSNGTPGEGGGATIYFNPTQSDEVHSEFDFVLCTAIVEYTTGDDGVVYKMRFPFNAHGLGDRDTAERFLEYAANME